MNKYIKVRLTSKNNSSTDSLIVNGGQVYDLTGHRLSGMFPYSEVVKIDRIEKSPEYATWNEAFDHQFDLQKTYFWIDARHLATDLSIAHGWAWIVDMGNAEYSVVCSGNINERPESDVLREYKDGIEQ